MNASGLTRASGRSCALVVRCLGEVWVRFLRLAAAAEEAGTSEGEQSGGCWFWDRSNAQGIEGEFIATTGASGVIAAPAQIIGGAFIETEVIEGHGARRR